MIIVVAGPTGSGKSLLALTLAKKYGGEIINGDAFQVYQELDIGTAKPTLKEREEVPHHLFDFISPSRDYNVKDYQSDLRETLEDLFRRNKLPIIVGGTGLYQVAGLYDYEFEEENEKVDMSDLENLSNEELHDMLKKIDITESQRIHPNNRKRVLRAIEIYRQSGKNKSEIISSQKHEMIYSDVIMVGLEFDRNELYRRIEKRVDEMFEQGLIDEVRQIVDKYGRNHHALLAIGYKEIIDAFDGKTTMDEACELIKKHTRNYAKRQFTFFKNKLPVVWFENSTQAMQYIDEKVNSNE